MNKSLFQSRTFWFNLLTAALQYADVIPVPAEYTALIVAGINIALRLLTTQPVTVIGR